MGAKRVTRGQFILRIGVLGWGIPTGLGWMLLMAFSEGVAPQNYLFPAVFTFPLGGAALGLLMWRFSPHRTASEVDSSSLVRDLRDSDAGLASKVIYAYQHRIFTVDRLYLLHVQDALQFVCAAGQLIAVQSKLYPEDPAAYTNPKLVQKYVGLDLGNPDVLRLDGRNFSIAVSEVRAIRLENPRTFGSRLPNSGRLYIDLVNGGTKKFILLGRQDRSAMLGLLAGAGIEVHGQPEPAAV